MSRKLFASLMSGLLAKLNIMGNGDLEQEVCTLHFDGQPDLHLINREQQYIDVICEVGRLPGDYSMEDLTALLELNRLEYNQPLVNVTIDTASGTVTILSRQFIHLLNVGTLSQILEVVQHKSRIIQTRLAGN